MGTAAVSAGASHRMSHKKKGGDVVFLLCPTQIPLEGKSKVQPQPPGVQAPPPHF